MLTITLLFAGIPALLPVLDEGTQQPSFAKGPGVAWLRDHPESKAVEAAVPWFQNEDAKGLDKGSSAPCRLQTTQVHRNQFHDAFFLHTGHEVIEWHLICLPQLDQHIQYCVLVVMVP